MEKRIAIKQEYLSIPIKVGERNKLFEIFIEKEDEKEKLFEFQIPIHARRHRRNEKEDQGARRPRVLLGDEVDPCHRAF